MEINNLRQKRQKNQRTLYVGGRQIGEYMETFEISQEKIKEILDKKREEIENIISLPIDDFKKYLRESILRTSIIVDGYDQAGEDIGLLDGILFSSLLLLRETINNTLQWLDRHYGCDVTQNNNCDGGDLEL